jgi:hypothetical protein
MKRHWIPACAGMTILKPKVLQTSSHAGDDGYCCGERKITTVIPAQAGIQRLSSCTNSSNL